MRRGLVALGGVAALAIAAGALWAYRLPLATAAATRLLERQGMGPVAFELDRFDLQGFHIHGLELARGQVAIGELTIAYSLGSLIGLHLDEATIEGLAIQLAAPASGPPGAPLTPASVSWGGLRIDKVHFADAHIRATAASGPVEAVVSGDLTLGTNELEATLPTIALTASIDGLSRRLDLVLPKLTLSKRDGGTVSLQVANAAATPTGLPWRAEALDAELDWGPKETAMKFAVGRLLNSDRPALVVPLRLTGTASATGPAVDFQLRLEAQAETGGNRVRMETKGRYDSAEDAGSAIMTLGPVEFRKGGAEPSQFFPRLGHDFDAVEGKMGIAGSIGWRKGRMLPHLILSLDGVAFDTAAARLSQVHGTVDVVDLWPPATAPGQKLTATVTASGLPPSALATEFQLRDSRLHVAHLELGFAGGRITAEPMVIDPTAAGLETALVLDQIDLSDLMTIIGVDGLAGTGRIDGRIPVSLRDGRIRVGEGKLAASGPGVLRFKSDKLPAELSGSGPEVAQALKALEDFHYDTLALELGEKDNGEGSLRLKISGNNPAVLDGQVFNININFESNFDRLAALALSSMESAQTLLKRAERSLKR